MRAQKAQIAKKTPFAGFFSKKLLSACSDVRHYRKSSSAHDLIRKTPDEKKFQIALCKTPCSINTTLIEGQSFSRLSKTRRSLLAVSLLAVSLSNGRTVERSNRPKGAPGPLWLGRGANLPAGLGPQSTSGSGRAVGHRRQARRACCVPQTALDEICCPRAGKSFSSRHSRHATWFSRACVCGTQRPLRGRLRCPTRCSCAARCALCSCAGGMGCRASQSGPQGLLRAATHVGWPLVPIAGPTGHSSLLGPGHTATADHPPRPTPS